MILKKNFFSGSPLRRKHLKKKAGSSKRSNGKSSSLTDLTDQKTNKSPDNIISSRHSASDLSPRSFEKSSSSSTGTVVPQKMFNLEG